MPKLIRVKTKSKRGFTEVTLLIKHPMKGGFRKNLESGQFEAVPDPDYIEKLTCEHNGKTVMSANLLFGVSENPFLSFKFKGGNNGDTVKITCVDNNGDTASCETTIGKRRGDKCRFR